MTLVQEVSDLAVATGTECKAINNRAGNLASLATTDKTTLVAAINEAFAAVSGGGVTNLSRTLAATTVTINSDTGSDAIVPAADGTNAGVMTSAMQVKLSGIEASADVTDAGNVGSTIHGASAKAVPVDADKLALIDTEAANVLKTLTVGVLKNLVIAAVSSGAPATLDTIDEIAAALGDDPNAISGIMTSLSNRVRTDTAAQGLNGTQQSNARTNIAAQASADIGDTATDFAAIFAAALV